MNVIGRDGFSLFVILLFPYIAFLRVVLIGSKCVNFDICISQLSSKWFVAIYTAIINV